MPKCDPRAPEAPTPAHGPAPAVRRVIRASLALLVAAAPVTGQEGLRVDAEGVTATILFEEVIDGGHIPELVGRYKLRVTEVAIAPGGHVGHHNHLGPGIRQMTEGAMEYLMPDSTVTYREGDFFFETGDVSHRVEDASGEVSEHLLFEILPVDVDGPSLIPPGEVSGTRTATLDSLRDLWKRHADAVLEENVDEELATYSESAVVIPPDHPVLTGSEEIRAWLEATFASVNIEQLEIEVADPTIEGDRAVAHYRYIWSVGPEGGEAARDTGSGVWVCERQTDGRWLIAYDVWNSDGGATDPMNSENDE